MKEPSIRPTAGVVPASRTGTAALTRPSTPAFLLVCVSLGWLWAGSGALIREVVPLRGTLVYLVAPTVLAFLLWRSLNRGFGDAPVSSAPMPATDRIVVQAPSPRTQASPAYAVVALLAGMGVACTPWWVAALARVYDYADHHFFWVPAAKTVRDATLATAICLPALACVILLLRRFPTGSGKRRFRGVLFGGGSVLAVAIGAFLWRFASERLSPASVPVALASIPIWIAAILSTLATAASPRPAVADTPSLSRSRKSPGTKRTEARLPAASVPTETGRRSRTHPRNKVRPKKSKSKLAGHRRR